MRETLRRIAALVLACFCVLTLGVGHVLAQKKIPPPYTFEQKEKDEEGHLSQGKVTFDHNIHLGKAENHKYDPKYEKTIKEMKCDTCHKGRGPAKLFQTKFGKTPDMNMKAYGEGERCGKCHDGKDSFEIPPIKEKDKKKEVCEKCHKEEKKG
jgi:c(7)-type cytochrome triheme protein